MAGDPDIGTGAQIDFDTSSYGYSGEGVELLSLNWSGLSRESIEFTHMETTSPGGRIFKPSDLYDPGTIDVEWHFNADLDPPAMTETVAETITITFDDGTTWVADGFMTDFSFSAPLEDKMVASATLKVTGDITIT